MPAVAGGDQHGVDVAAGEQLAEVAVEHAVVVAVMLVDQFLAGFAAAGLDVADGHAPTHRSLQNATQVVGHTGTDSDHPQHDPLARRRRAVSAQGACRNDRRQCNCTGRGDGLSEELTARAGPRWGSVGWHYSTKGFWFRFQFSIRATGPVK